MKNVAVGLAIRKLRKQRQLPAKELASTVGMADYKLSRIESGESGLSFPEAIQVASALRISMSEFADLVEKIQPQPEMTEMIDVKARFKKLQKMILEDTQEIRMKHRL